MTTFIEKGEVGILSWLIGAHELHHLEPGDVSDSDDDIEVGGVTQDYKCPLTLTPLEDPLTSYAFPSLPTVLLILTHKFQENVQTLLLWCCNPRVPRSRCEKVPRDRV